MTETHTTQQPSARITWITQRSFGLLRLVRIDARARLADNLEGRSA